MFLELGLLCVCVGGVVVVLGIEPRVLHIFQQVACTVRPHLDHCIVTIPHRKILF